MAFILSLAAGNSSLLLKESKTWRRVLNIKQNQWILISLWTVSMHFFRITRISWQLNSWIWANFCFYDSFFFVFFMLLLYAHLRLLKVTIWVYIFEIFFFCLYQTSNGFVVSIRKWVLCMSKVNTTSLGLNLTNRNTTFYKSSYCNSKVKS